MLKAEERAWALGAMSGTSLDGVDAAMVLTDGRDLFDFGETAYRPYTADERVELHTALGGRDETGKAREIVDAAHVRLLSRFSGASLVGFHGQTLCHCPEKGFSFQAGDGNVLASALGIPVVWDFRRMDIERGGQGAPLAPFFHFACAKWIGVDAPLVFLNIGGVANLTYVDPRFAGPEYDGALLAFDTGPGNARLNDLMKTRRGTEMDEDGATAVRGCPDETILNSLAMHEYFRRDPPKSLDRDDFSFLERRVLGLSDEDAAATITAGIVAAAVNGTRHCPEPPSRVLVAGGGRKNPVLMRMLEDGMACPVEPVEAAGMNGDMLEAQAFAYLAVRAVKGLSISAPGTTGVRIPTGGGCLSYPGAPAILNPGGASSKPRN